VDRKLKKAINDFQRLESDFRQEIANSQIRQLLIVNPEASEKDKQDIMDNPATAEGIFQQAVS
jgi:syntaxin 1B/2/3